MQDPHIYKEIKRYLEKQCAALKSFFGSDMSGIDFSLTSRSGLIMTRGGESFRTTPEGSSSNLCISPMNLSPGESSFTSANVSPLSMNGMHSNFSTSATLQEDIFENQTDEVTAMRDYLQELFVNGE